MAEQVSLWSVSDLVDSSSTKSQDGHNWPTFAPLGFSKVFLSHLKNVVSSEGGTTHNSSDPSPTSNATSFYDEISPDCLLPPQSASLPSQLLTLNMQFLVSSQKQEAERDQRADFSSSCHKDSCVMDTGSEQKMISPDHSLTKWNQAAVHSETKDERVDNRVSSEKRQKYGNRRDTTAEKKRKKISASSQDTNEHIEDIRRFARAFKMKRLSLGLTQTQIGRALTAADGPAYSQSAICRFEKLDITPKSAQRIKPVLERWLAELEGKKCPEQTPGLEENFVEDAVTRKRKSRTNFSTDALARLNCEFATNTHPSGFPFPPENQPNLYAMDGPLANMTTQMPGCGTNNGGSPSGDTGSTDLDDTWLPLDLSIRRRDSAQ